MGVEPTKDRLSAPPGFEVRTCHRACIPSRYCFYYIISVLVVVVSSVLLPNCYHFYFPFFATALLIMASIWAAAFACIPGITWLYRSRVIPIVEWPSRSLAIFG